MRYRVFDNRVKLIDSYLVPKRKFSRELTAIRNLHPDIPLWKTRSIRSMRLEWAAHNLLYDLGIRRTLTADVDLNYELRWYQKVGFGILGSFALLFIK